MPRLISHRAIDLMAAVRNLLKGGFSGGMSGGSSSGGPPLWPIPGGTLTRDGSDAAPTSFGLNRPPWLLGADFGQRGCLDSSQAFSSLNAWSANRSYSAKSPGLPIPQDKAWVATGMSGGVTPSRAPIMRINCAPSGETLSSLAASSADCAAAWKPQLRCFDAVANAESISASCGCAP